MKNDKLVKIGSVVLVLAVMIFFGVNYTAKAGTSFWGGLQSKMAVLGIDKLFSNAPDLSIEDIVDPTFGSVISSDSLQSPICVNDLCTYVYSGSFLNATNTLFAIQNPFPPVSFNGTATTTGATTTVAFFTINIDGPATTTMRFMMGTSTVASLDISSGSTQISESLISATLATSSTAFYSSITAGGYPTGGTDAGTTFSSIQLGPTEYLVAYASSTNDAAGDYNGGVVGNSNTFSGTYTIEIKAAKR